MRNGVQIVCVVLVIGFYHIHIMILQLYKQQRQTIDKTYDVGSPTVIGSLDPQLTNGNKAILLRICKVNHFCFSCARSSVWSGIRNIYAIPYQLILCLIGLHERSCRDMAMYLLDSFFFLLRCDPRVELSERTSKIAFQYDLVFTSTSQCTVLTQFLTIKRKDGFPLQFIME